MWNDENEQIIVDALETLVDAALIDNTERPGYPVEWFEQHPLLRAYGLHLLRQDDKYKEVIGRYQHAIIFAAGDIFHRSKYADWKDFIPFLPHVHGVGDFYLDQVVKIVRDLQALTNPTLPPAIEQNQNYYLISKRNSSPRKSCGFSQLQWHPYVRFSPEIEHGYKWFLMGLTCTRLLGISDGELATTFEIGKWHNEKGNKVTARQIFREAAQ